MEGQIFGAKITGIARNSVKQLNIGEIDFESEFHVTVTIMMMYGVFIPSFDSTLSF